MTTRESPTAEATRLISESLHYLAQYRGVRIHGIEVQYPSGQVLVGGDPLRVVPVEGKA